MPDLMPPTQDHTENLADQASAGDASSLSELYQAYIDPTFRWAHARTKDHATAEDITSELWQRVVKTIHTFRSQGPGSFVKWLFTMARRILIDHFRSSGRSREQFTPDMLDLDTVAPDVSPDEVAERHELADRLARMVRRLSARQAECIKLRFYHGFSLAETAALLEIEENAVKQLQHRALSRLRTLLPAGADRNVLLWTNVLTSSGDTDSVASTTPTPENG